MSGLPTGTDLAERMIAFQRRNAGSVFSFPTAPENYQYQCTRHPHSASRLRDRTERSGAPANTREQPSAAPPAAAAAAGPSRERAAPPTATASSSRAAVSPRKRPAPSASPKVSLDAHADEFSRKLRISDSTRAGGGSGANPSRTNTDRKLYNPNAADTTAATTLPPSQQQHPNSSLRRSAVEHSSAAAAAASEAAGNGYASRRSPKNAQAAQHRQLFDPRKDDPMRFSRPTASPSSKVSTADHASSASGSSYAPSIASSSWTLNTTTTDDSSMGDTPGKADESTTNAFSAQLKRLYRAITALEAKIINEDAAENNEDVRVVLRGAQDAPVDEEAEIERWRKVVADHKR
jgi:protein SMG6